MPQFVWDHSNTPTNEYKHAISFELATHIRDDPAHLILLDGIYGREERWLIIGRVGHLTILVAVYVDANDAGDMIRLISARKATRKKYVAMTNRPLTEVELRQLKALEALPDDEIDTSDIPEISDEAWAGAQRGALYRPLKQSVTIRLDADILVWFRQQAEGRGYQTDINAVLRRHVMAQKPA